MTQDTSRATSKRRLGHPLRCVLVALCVLPACKPRKGTESYLRDTRRLDFGVSSRTQTDFLLLKSFGYVPSVKFEKIEGERHFVAGKGNEGQGEPTSLNHIRVTLPGLGSQDSFLLLMKAYGGADSSRVKYSKGHRYSLQDFLPPLVQALVGRRFDVAKVDEKLQGTGGWNIALEILRNAKDTMTLGLVPAAVAARELESDMHTLAFRPPLDRSLIVEEGGVVPRFRGRTAAEELKPGDFLLVHREATSAASSANRELVHAAVVVDSDFFFEQVRVQGGYAFRFARFRDILDLLARQRRGNVRDFKFSFRRPRTGRKTIPFKDLPDVARSSRILGEVSLGLEPVASGGPEVLGERWAPRSGGTVTLLPIGKN